MLWGVLGCQCSCSTLISCKPYFVWWRDSWGAAAEKLLSVSDIMRLTARQHIIGWDNVRLLVLHGWLIQLLSSGDQRLLFISWKCPAGKFLPPDRCSSITSVLNIKLTPDISPIPMNIINTCSTEITRFLQLTLCWFHALNPFCQFVAVNQMHRCILNEV